jgi:UDP-glucose 4-epimerase
MKKNETILLTGGLGYIGSHIAVDLILDGYDIVIVDNLSNSRKSVLSQIEEITQTSIVFIEGDLLDRAFLDKLFKSYIFDLVVHLAGLKSVPESLRDPYKYFHENINGSLNLLKMMKDNNIYKIIYSSSAAIYNGASGYPIKEDDQISPKTPYAMSKYFIEEILGSFADADNFSFLSLRYFNPVGAHHTYLIGEFPLQPPSNLMPLLCEAATGKRTSIDVFGGDYKTHDGTCIRDFIHISDLSSAHIKAVNFLLRRDIKCKLALNIGTGIGYSVLDLIKQFKLSLSIDIKYNITSRRSGDLPISLSDPTEALKVLSWKAVKNLSDMCIDSFMWHKKMSNI